VLSGRCLCDELITRPEEFYRLCCVVVCDLETSRIDAPYIDDISHLRVNDGQTDRHDYDYSLLATFRKRLKTYTLYKSTACSSVHTHN
jgi:hypothetical protein